LANAGKIAIGSVRIILDGLVKNEFLIEDNGLKKLVNRKTLIDRWLTNYQDRLKPGLLIGRFRSANGIINTEAFQNGKIFISGEFGADVLTNYLKPTVFEGYTSMTKQEIISELRLIPDNNGNIEFYNKFWQDNFSQNKNNLATNLLNRYK